MERISCLVSFFSAILWWKAQTPLVLGKPKLDESDPKFDEWDVDNFIILGWMFNSMKD